jgi:hypothetical protein
MIYFLIFLCQEVNSELVHGDCEITKDIEDVMTQKIGHKIEKNYSIYFVRKKNFIIIEESEQNNINYTKLRDLLFNFTHSTPKIIQVIGSSDPFSESGTSYAYLFLCQYLNNYNCTVQYGYTGSKTTNLDRLGANDLVSKYLEENPIESPRFVANIVAKSYIYPFQIILLALRFESYR